MKFASKMHLTMTGTEQTKIRLHDQVNAHHKLVHVHNKVFHLNNKLGFVENVYYKLLSKQNKQKIAEHTNLNDAFNIHDVTTAQKMKK